MLIASAGVTVVSACVAVWCAIRGDTAAMALNLVSVAWNGTMTGYWLLRLRGAA